MKYTTLFETTAEFNAAQPTLDTPNVSLVEETMEVSFMPYVAPEIDPYLDDPKLVVIYNVSSTEEDTPLFSVDYISYFSSMEIDGLEFNELVATYRFNTTGEHVIKYVYDDTKLNGLFYDNAFIKKMYIPNTITNIYSTMGSALSLPNLEFISIPNSINNIYIDQIGYCPNLNKIRCTAISAPSLDANTFTGVSQTGTLYVPTGATGYDDWLTALGNGWTLVEE
jgi:hypothetical protein